MINKPTKEEALLRLRKIEGQIRGLEKMIQEERYCIDIVNQISAVVRALEQVALVVMKRHVESCVAEAIKRTDGRQKIGELIDTIEKFIK